MPKARSRLWSYVYLGTADTRRIRCDSGEGWACTDCDGNYNHNTSPDTHVFLDPLLHSARKDIDVSALNELPSRLHPDKVRRPHSRSSTRVILEKKPKGRSLGFDINQAEFKKSPFASDLLCR